MRCGTKTTLHLATNLRRVSVQLCLRSVTVFWWLFLHGLGFLDFLKVSNPPRPLYFATISRFPSKRLDIFGLRAWKRQKSRFEKRERLIKKGRVGGGIYSRPVIVAGGNACHHGVRVSVRVCGGCAMHDVWRDIACTGMRAQKLPVRRTVALHTTTLSLCGVYCGVFGQPTPDNDTWLHTRGARSNAWVVGHTIACTIL